MTEVLFEVQGKPVKPGDTLWVHPSREPRAGTRVRAFRPAVRGEALMRTDDGALPVVSIECLSWSPWALNLVAEARRSAGSGERNRQADAVWADAIAWAVANPEDAARIAASAVLSESCGDDRGACQVWRQLLVLRPRENERAVLEDAAGVGHAEGPPNRAPFVRRRATPRTDVTTEGGQVGNPAPAEALARNQARLHLGGIQPARVLRRVVDREALPKCAAAALAKRVAASLLGVRAQVVGDEVDAPGLRVRLRDSMQRASEVAVLAASRRVRQPPPCLGLDDAEDVRRPPAHVLVVGSRRAARRHRRAGPRGVAQDDRAFIETDDGLQRVQRARVQAQHVLHPLDELGADRRHAPHFFPATA